MHKENGITFEWDEKKRQANFAKHSVDFMKAKEVFADPNIRIEQDIRYRYDEERFNAYGFADGMRLRVCFTKRGENVIRVISIFRVHLKEWEKYYGNG